MKKLKNFLKDKIEAEMSEADSAYDYYSGIYDYLKDFNENKASYIVEVTFDQESHWLKSISIAKSGSLDQVMQSVKDILVNDLKVDLYESFIEYKVFVDVDEKIELPIGYYKKYIP